MIASCSMHKRKYAPGYFVQWNLKKNDRLFRNNSNEFNSSNKEQLISNEKLIASYTKTPLSISTKPFFNNHSRTNESKNILITNKVSDYKLSLFTKQKKNTETISSGDQPDKKKSKKRVGLVSLFGLIFGIIGSFLFPFTLGILAILFGIAGIFFSVINKEKYGHIGIPIFAIVLGIFDISIIFISITTLTAFFIILILSLIFLVAIY
jgi:hypothetical protein